MERLQEIVSILNDPVTRMLKAYMESGISTGEEYPENLLSQLTESGSYITSSRSPHYYEWFAGGIQLKLVEMDCDPDLGYRYALHIHQSSEVKRSSQEPNRLAYALDVVATHLWGVNGWERMHTTDALYSGRFFTLKEAIDYSSLVVEPMIYFIKAENARIFRLDKLRRDKIAAQKQEGPGY